MDQESCPIYLDYAATTPLDERVLAAMLPFFCTHFGNPASQHSRGRTAADAVQRAREQVAALIHCSPADIIWTSGATEANNLAIKGVVRAQAQPGSHVISQVIEHKAILDPLNVLRTEGAAVTLLEVKATGLVDLEAFERNLKPETVLVSLMAANNELGTLTPINEIGDICHKAGVPFHTDASQAAGKIPLDMEAFHIDLLSISGHKLYAPKGIGALAFRRGPKLRKLKPLFDGGGHERGMRSGTLNVPGIVGLGRACEIARTEMDEEARRIRGLREEFEVGLLCITDVYINGCDSPRLPNITNAVFPGVDAESLLLALDQIDASTGSACTAASLEPSHVLKAIGLPETRQLSSVRFSFGRQSTSNEIRLATDMIVSAVQSLRELSLAASGL